LEKDVEYYKAQAVSVASDEGTNVVVGGLCGRNKKYLPEGTKIGFVVGKGLDIEVGVNSTGDGVSVFVGGGYLAFWPECTNVGTLKVVQR
jgi:hypothetical protein